MIFKQLNPSACKTYLLVNETSNKAILIDPVINHVTMYLSLMKENKYKLTHVIDTHTHADHISACPSLRDATDCEYVMHNLSPSKCVSIRVKNKEIITMVGKSFKVMHTPGHTRDSISLLLDNLFFSGDFLFLEDAGAGRDDLPGGSPEDHYNSLLSIATLSDQVMVYPAHEYRNRKPSTMKIQRLTNPHLKHKSKEAFINYINDLRLGPAAWMKDVLNANYKCSRDPNSAWIPTDLPACEIKGTANPNEENIDVSYISSSKLFQYLTENQHITLIDLREKYELKDKLGHLENIIHIPIGQLTNRLEQLSQYEDSNIILLCRSGARATSAAKILFTANFTNIYVLEGGMMDYRLNGF